MKTSVSSFEKTARENNISESFSETDYQNCISTLSHEVKNQLTLMDSSMQLLSKKYPEIAESPLWQQICQDLHETFRVLKTACSFATSKSLYQEPIHIKSFLTNIARSFSSMMHEKGIYFDAAFDDCLSSVFISADATKLKEVLTNLILNAVDALCLNTPDSLSKNRCISLLAGLDSQNLSCLNIHVKDNGPGIPDEYLPTLFDPFVTHKANGNGLGLFIVKDIINQHSGSISVQTSSSGNDTYTDFRIQLPLIQV